MAKRPIFISEKKIIEIDIEFKWYPGFSIIQKQKSIRSLHDNFIKQHPKHKVLEVSTKSQEELGRNLSAFNLKNKDGKTVEELYQIGKVFKDDIQIDEDSYSNVQELRKRIKSMESPIKYFKYENVIIDINPPTLFYDWLYIKVLLDNKELTKQLKDNGFDSFTDIEFNPVKQINCQARALAIYIFLEKNDYFKQNPTFSIDKFKSFYESYLYNFLV